MARKAAPQAIIIPYRPRPFQAVFHENAKRFNVAVCHRRFGKTAMAVNWLLQGILTCPNKNAQGAYIAPTYSAAKRIAWTMFREYAGVIPGVNFNEAELRIDLPDGKRIWLLGAENPDALRGMRLDAAVLDEFADMNSRLYPEIIRPALSDFGTGACLWIGTPRGENQFKDIYEHAILQVEKGAPDWFAMRMPASETNVLPAAELEDARATMDPSQFAQEYEVSWSAALVGAYYADALDRADANDQIGNVPWEPNLEVNTAWDLGVADSTVIIFFQTHRNEIRIIDSYDSSGEGLHHYVKTLRERPYTYGRHYFPHDVLVRELGSGSSRYEMLQAMKVRPTVVAKLTVMDGIEAVRGTIPRCYFDRGNAAPLLKALRHYHRTMNDRTGEWNSRPNHDWSSHFADAFRYLAVGLRDGDENADIAQMAKTGLMMDGRPVIDSGDGAFG